MVMAPDLTAAGMRDFETSVVAEKKARSQPAKDLGERRVGGDLHDRDIGLEMETDHLTDDRPAVVGFSSCAIDATITLRRNARDPIACPMASGVRQRLVRGERAFRAESRAPKTVARNA